MMTRTSDRVVEALARLSHYANHPRTAKPGAPAPMTIALSRQAGAGGAEIAQNVGARLGWPVYDHELLDRIAEEKGLNARLLERLDERFLGWLEEAAHNFVAPQGHQVADYLRGLLAVLASLGKSGHCIIVGHGAPHVLPSDTTLRVRLIGPHDFRIAQVQNNLQLSRRDAERWIERTERERQRFLDRHFDARSDDPFAYDLVLNRQHLGVDECAGVIVQALRAREPHAPLVKEEGFQVRS
jgi:cytidylate kinase